MASTEFELIVRPANSIAQTVNVIYLFLSCLPLWPALSSSSLHMGAASALEISWRIHVIGWACRLQKFTLLLWSTLSYILHLPKPSTSSRHHRIFDDYVVLFCFSFSPWQLLDSTQLLFPCRQIAYAAQASLVALPQLRTYLLKLISLSWLNRALQTKVKIYVVVQNQLMFQGIDTDWSTPSVIVRYSLRTVPEWVTSRFTLLARSIIFISVAMLLILNRVEHESRFDDNRW